MSKSINKQRNGLPKIAHQPAPTGPTYPVPIHPAFRDRLQAIWAEGQTLQAQMNGLQRRFNEIMDLAKTMAVEAGQIAEGAIVQDINTGWVLPPPPEPQTGSTSSPTATVSETSTSSVEPPAEVEPDKAG